MFLVWNQALCTKGHQIPANAIQSDTRYRSNNCAYPNKALLSGPKNADKAVVTWARSFMSHGTSQGLRFGPA